MSALLLLLLPIVATIIGRTEPADLAELVRPAPPLSVEARAEYWRDQAPR